MLPCRSVVEMIVSHARRDASSARDGASAADSARARGRKSNQDLIVRDFLTWLCGRLCFERMAVECSVGTIETQRTQRSHRAHRESNLTFEIRFSLCLC